MQNQYTAIETEFLALSALRSTENEKQHLGYAIFQEGVTASFVTRGLADPFLED